MNATTKNAAAATLLSVLLPGLGHLYLGEPALAFAWLVLGVVTFPLGWPIGAPIAAYSDTDTVNKANVADEYAPIYMAQQGRRQDEERQERLEDSRRRDRRDDRLDEAVIMRGSR